MSSIAHAAGTAASPTGARVTSIEEGRAEHDHGYFFRMPDWLADALCAHHASGAAWALVTLIGRKTRWGPFAPQRITLQEMLETTHYSRQALVDALAALASSGVLYEEREPRGKWVRYALVDRTTCTGPYTGEDGHQVIDLLNVPAYPLPEHGLKCRPREESLYRSKKQTTDGLKSRPSWSKMQTKNILNFRPHEAVHPAPEQAPEARLDYGDKRDTKDSFVRGALPPSGARHSSQYQPTPAAAVTGQPHPVAAARPAPKGERKRDPLWDTAVVLFHQPMGGELKDWRYNIVPELHRQGITPEHLQQAAQRYRREHPTWNYSFKAVFNHLGELLTLPQSTPGPTLAAAYHYAPAVPAYMLPGKGAN